MADARMRLLDVIGEGFRILRGHPFPLGTLVGRGGVNFSVFSRNATGVTLVLHYPGDEEPLIEFPLDPRFNKTGDIWHAFILGLNPGIEYGYRVDGPPDPALHLHRFDPAIVLLDPRAKALTGGEAWGDRSASHCATANAARRPRRSLLVNDEYDWEYDQPLNIPLAASVICELHVRGFTQHPSAGVSHRGTFAGLVEKIPYLRELGVTAVELLPVNEFEENDTGRVNPLTGERLLNYWGYHSLSFFAPKASYAADHTHGTQVTEFKSMVKALHRAGIEVILDVVFNHTAEGDARGETTSLRGFDNAVYYLLDRATGAYANYSGCGNTLNCNHPVVRDLILDSLRYWVTEMHVDGFRFDLASILGRGQDGSVLSNPPLLERIAGDPVLSSTKIIAEAWDAAGLYQVGTFPAWGRWAEWNGKFRDDVRRYIRGEPGMVSILAARLMGSPDIYRESGRETYHSINFVTAHDGFTLADLVAFDAKRNTANGEDDRDGTNENLSWNCGHEGLDNVPADVATLRHRQARNFLAALLLSRGVPMLLAGDERGRTQGGNNNAYCQDNPTSWIDWNTTTDEGLLRFVRLLIRLRARHPGVLFDRLRPRSRSRGDAPDGLTVIWHGVRPHDPDWSEASRSIALQIAVSFTPGATAAEETPPPCPDLYCVFSSFWEPLTFRLPAPITGNAWCRVVDTSCESPEDIVEPGCETPLPDQQHYLVNPRTVVVLAAGQPPAGTQLP